MALLTSTVLPHVSSKIFLSLHAQMQMRFGCTFVGLQIVNAVWVAAKDVVFVPHARGVLRQVVVEQRLQRLQVKALAGCVGGYHQLQLAALYPFS